MRVEGFKVSGRRCGCGGLRGLRVSGFRVRGLEGC